MKFRDVSSNDIGKSILKIKAGESVLGVFRGEPVDFRQHWSNNRSTVCTGRASCDLCKAGEKSAFRFRINFIAKDDSGYAVKVFEQGKAVYEALKLLNSDYDLEKNVVKITRQGSGTDTTYTILPKHNGVLAKEADEAISALPLHVLASAQAAPAVEQDGPEAPADENIPF